MQRPLCLCSLARKIRLETKVSIVMSPTEWNKTSNTGRLAPLCLENCGIFIRGEKGRRFDPSTLIEHDAENLVLFPGGEDIRVWKGSHGGRKTHLIVPDGTWESAARIIAREPALSGLRRVSAPGGCGTSMRLRKSNAEERLSTLEAVASALSVLEGEEAASLLLSVLNVKRERVLWARGRLRTEDVTTGIPVEAVEWKTSPVRRP